MQSAGLTKCVMRQCLVDTITTVKRVSGLLDRKDVRSADITFRTT